MIVFLGATCWENTGWWSYPKKKSIRIIKVQEQHLKICQWRAKQHEHVWLEMNKNIFKHWISDSPFGFLSSFTPKHVLYPTTNKGILRPPNMWSSMWLSEELWVQWHPMAPEKRWLEDYPFLWERWHFSGSIFTFGGELHRIVDSYLCTRLYYLPIQNESGFWCLIPPDSCFSAAWLGWLISPHAHA